MTTLSDFQNSQNESVIIDNFIYEYINYTYEQVLNFKEVVCINKNEKIFVDNLGNEIKIVYKNYVPFFYISDKIICFGIRSCFEITT